MHFNFSILSVMYIMYIVGRFSLESRDPAPVTLWDTVDVRAQFDSKWVKTLESELYGSKPSSLTMFCHYHVPHYIL